MFSTVWERQPPTLHTKQSATHSNKLINSNFPLLSHPPLGKLHRLPCSQILFFESTRWNMCEEVGKWTEMRSESNAITCAGVILMEFLCYHQRKYFYKWNIACSCSHNMKPSHGTNQSGRGKGTPKHQREPSYLKMSPDLKLLNRKRRKGCLCKLSTKSQSQTHLNLPDCRSAFNFSRLRVPVPVSHRNPVSFLLKHHVQKAH